jgi:diguanylate cyclase (GGDEF)-like protein
VDLVQGGRAFIARSPIYARDPDDGGEPRYWGLASIVIDTDSLFATTGIMPDTPYLRLAVRGKDGLGAAGGMILGEPGVFTADAVVQEVLLPNGTWELAAVPQGGWASGPWLGTWVRLPGWLSALVIAGLIMALLRTREQNRVLALHDPLTGLPNRRLLEDRFETLAARSPRSGTGFGFFYVDLDGFKAINDRFGHKVGDALLVEVGERMRGHVRAADTVARIGGDEFVLITEGVADRAGLEQVAAHLRDQFQGELRVHGHRVPVRASLGVALYPDDGETLDDLMRHADEAMYVQKRAPGR